jgi:hypothetical protein
MKKVGIIFLGLGFGILLYIIFSFFFSQNGVVSPLEGVDANKVIKQNVKE